MNTDMSRQAVRNYLLAVLTVALGLLLRLPVWSVLGTTAPFITFFPSVMLAAWVGGLGPGLLSTALGALVTMYVFFEPFGTFRTARAEDSIPLLLFLCFGAFISWAAGRMHRAQRSERQLRIFSEQTLAGIGDGVIATDTEERITLMNSVAEEITGWRFDEVRGEPLERVFRIVDEQTGAAVEAPIRRALHEGSAQSLADLSELITRDGRRIPVDDSAAPTRDEHGKVVGAVLVFRDITERRQAMREVQSSRENLRSTVQRDGFLLALDDAVRPMVDPQELTQTAARLLGVHLGANRCAYADVEPDENTFNLTGDYNHDVPSIVGRYTFAQFGAECLRLMREGRPYVVEDSETDPRTEEVRESYRQTLIRSVICVPLLKQDRFVAAMAVHQTTPRRWRPEETELVARVASRCWESIERARVTREVQEREARFRFLAESIPQMVWTATADGLLDYINGQAIDYFGAHPNHVLGAAWLKWVHPEDQKATIERWKHSLATGESYESGFRLRRASDGTWRWHLVRALAMAGQDGRARKWFGTCTDIEDQKAIEAELTRANKSLEEFAYVASHDLQEPMRMVNSYTQLLIRRIGPQADEEMRQFAAFVQSGVKRMEKLIQDMLSYSRTVQMVEEMPPTEASLDRALQQALSRVETRVAETKAVITSSALPVVAADESQLAHVLQNLLSNALKYRHPERNPIVHIDAERRDGRWVVAVRDNGIGFQPQYAKQVFGLFKRLHGNDAYSGTGLGLAICKRIVERFGGEIWAQSEPGVGSTFSFSLPPVDERDV